MEKLTKDSPETRSLDVVAENIAQLKALFPEATTEGRIDFDALKALLGESVEDREERYGLNWFGKRKARLLALTPSRGTLRPDFDGSFEWTSTENLLIEGDNLEVLKLLQKSYSGKVDVIYIDPPYNKGKDFVYCDNYTDSIGYYKTVTRQVDENSKPISSESEILGRRHTNWLNMIYPRLKVANSILSKNGVIFVSIDDNELHELRLVMNEVFGEENFVATIPVVTNMKGRNDKKHVAPCHEYLVIYAKPEFKSFGLPLTEEQKAVFKYEDELGRKYARRDMRKRGGPDKKEDRPNMFFTIYYNEETQKCSLTRISEFDIEIIPLKSDGSEGRWRWGKEKAEKHIDWLHPKRSNRSGVWGIEHRIYLDPSVDPEDEEETDSEVLDSLLEDGIDEDVIERTSKPKSIWIGPEFSSDSGKRAYKALLPGDTFDFPKSIDLIKNCIQIGTNNSGLILDFFAGSGTTAQAIFELNQFDGGNRKFILVQMPEHLDTSVAEQKKAALFCDKMNKPRSLSEITKERIRRASKAIKENNPLFPFDGGFRVYRLDSSNVQPWDPAIGDIQNELPSFVANIKEDRSVDDLLTELLLKLGLKLNEAIDNRTIAGKTVHSIGTGVLMVCLDEAIAKADYEALSNGILAWHRELAPIGETTLVFRDSAFADDVVKTNLTAIFSQGGLDNVRSL